MRVHRSFAFVDVSGFTALTELEGDERAVDVLTAFRALLRDICSRRGVRIVKWLGDGVMLVCVDTRPLLETILELHYVVGDVSIDGATSVAAEVEGAGGRALGLLCDVRREDSVTAFVERAVAEFGTVDAVDHNAAWSHQRLDTDAVGVDLGVWQRAIEITTRGALLLARHAIPVMVAGGGGSFVAISSGTSTIGESTRVAYGVSKAALNQLTRHLAVRYGRDGIRANAIAPGFIHTETAATQVPADVQTRLAEANPTRRLGTPDDIARVVLFLCSDDAAYVNGQVLHVDGGHQIAGMM